jgi:hypothetical protein
MCICLPSARPNVPIFRHFREFGWARLSLRHEFRFGFTEGFDHGKQIQKCTYTLFLTFPYPKTRQ